MIRLETGDVLVVAGAVLGLSPEDLAGSVELGTITDALERAWSPPPPDPGVAASRLFAELSRARPFPTANAAIAWLAACQLLSLNGMVMAGADDQADLGESLVAVAAGTKAAEDLEDWIRGHCLPQQGLSRKKGGPMFERFTDRARRVLVLAPVEAAGLGHGFIGTEHLLLGLLAEGDGVAARALGAAGISLDAARDQVRARIGPSAPQMRRGAPPFTARAKKVLELARREAVDLGHNYMGTEHILLGLITEGEGVGPRTIEALGVDLVGLRQRVLDLLANYPKAHAAPNQGTDREELRDRILADVEALATRVGELEAEVGFLRGVLHRHGIEPNGGERSA